MSFTVARYWCTSVWLGPKVRGIPLSQSLPTANTHELLLVVVRPTLGAPAALLAAAVAPMPPDPLLPEVFAPVKATTVIDAATCCDRATVTLAPLKGDGATARQTSAVPRCWLSRRTSVQVRPPPLTCWTVVLGDVTSSPATNARSSSLL